MYCLESEPRSLLNTYILGVGNKPQTGRHIAHGIKHENSSDRCPYGAGREVTAKPRMEKKPGPQLRWNELTRDFFLWVQKMNERTRFILPTILPAGMLFTRKL